MGDGSIRAGRSVWVSLALLYASVFAAVSWCYWWLPPALPASAPADVFAADRALAHLDAMLESGVRTVGNHATEHVTPQYLEEQLLKMQAQFQEHVLLEVEVQHPSGGFPTGFLGGFTNTYSRVTNVIARLSFKGHASMEQHQKDALLINAHYDSAIGSLAASDDTVYVASMLELVRVLSERGAAAAQAGEAPPTKQALVFLFNGAEETNWQAAHGFVTQHRWAPSLRAVVNLEACGAGGRELVIQTGPANSWIALAYANNAPYPRAFTLAQEIFQSGVLPGETDFQVFRDYGGMPGIDLANIEDGYVYHTMLDAPNRIQRGSVQRSGENVLEMILAMANSPYLVGGGEAKDDQAVYFDLLGTWVVVYSQQTAHILHICSVLGTVLLLTYTRSWNSGLVRGMGCLLAAVLAGVLMPVMVGVVLSLTGGALAWYSSLPMVVGLFGCSSIAGSLFVRSWYHRRAKGTTRSDAQMETEAFSAGLVLWVVILLLFALNNLASAYSAALWVAPPLAARLVSVALVPDHRKARSVMFPALACAGALLPTLVWAQYSMTIMDFFQPLMGRVGTEVPGDMFLGVVIGLMLSLLTMLPLSLVHLSSPRATRNAIVGLFGVTAICLVLAHATFPYSSTHPKRLYLQHTLRRFRALPEGVTSHVDGDGVTDALVQVHEDSGMWINPMDHLGLEPLREQLADNIPEFENPQVRPCEHDPAAASTALGKRPLYCNLPWYFSIAEMIKNGWWIDSPSPEPVLRDAGYEPAALRLVRETDGGDSSTRRLHFRLTGPSHLGVAISAVPLANDAAADGSATAPPVSAWSFTADVPSPRLDCNCYYVFHSGSGEGYHADPASVNIVEWEFWLDVRKDFGPIDVAGWGQYLMVHTPTIHHFTGRMPEWLTYTDWTSTWEGGTY